MALYEPRQFREQRLARQEERYPELEVAQFDDLAKVDNLSRQQTGVPFTQFGRDSDNLYVRNLPGTLREYGLQNFESNYVQDTGFKGFVPRSEFEAFKARPKPEPEGDGGLDILGGFSGIADLPGVDQALRNTPLGAIGNVVGVGQDIAHGNVGGLAQRLPGADFVNLARDPGGTAEDIVTQAVGESVSSNPPTRVLDLFRDREDPTNLREAGQSLLGGLQDIDTVTGLPIRTPIRQGSQTLTDPAGAFREQFEQEQQGGIGYGLEGAAPFEQLRRIPGIEKDIPATEISAFDITLGTADILLDIGGIVGAARHTPEIGRGLRTYQRLTQNIPIGASLRDISGDIEITRRALGLSDDLTPDEVIDAARRMRPEVRAHSLSNARSAEQVQLAKQKLELIDNLIANAPPAPPGRALPPGAPTPDGRELFVAVDRNSGQYVVHSNQFTTNIDEATRFFTRQDLDDFARNQPYPVDPVAVRAAAGDVQSTPLPAIDQTAPRRRTVRPTPPQGGTQPDAFPPGFDRPPTSAQVRRSVAQARAAREADEIIPPSPNPNLPTAPRGAPSTLGDEFPPGFERPPTSAQVRGSIESARAAREAAENAPTPRNPNIPIAPRGVPDFSSTAPRGFEGPPTSAQVRRAVQQNKANALQVVTNQEEAVSAGRVILRTASDIFNLPRSLMAGLDHSFPGRQGWPMMTRSHWWRAWGPSLRSWLPQKWDDYAIRRNDELLGGPMIREAARRGDQDAIEALRWVDLKAKYRLEQVAFGEIGDDLSIREEAFVSRWSDHIPLVNASERGYVTFGNELRDGFFKAKYGQAQRLVADGVWDAQKLDDHMREVSRWLNEVTGRGDLPDRMARSDLLAASGGTFFSPRHNISRFQVLGNVLRTINPKSSLSRQMRMEIARDMVGFVGGNLLGLAILDYYGVVNVEWDRRSTDFAKGRIPISGERYDPWAGFQQIVRYISQIIEGESVDAITGETRQIEGNVFERAGDLGVGGYVRSKLGPVPSVVVDLMTGETMIGEPVEPSDLGEPMFYTRFLPLSPADIYQAAQAEGLVGGLRATPANFGISYNRYQGTGDVLDAISLEKFGVYFRELENSAQQNWVRDQQEYKDKVEEQKAKRDDGEITRSDVATAGELYDVRGLQLERDLERLLSQGLSGEALIEEVQDFKANRYELGQTIYGGDIGAYLDQFNDDKEAIELLAEQYWSAPVPMRVTDSGEIRYNFDAREEYRDAVLREMQRLGLDEDTIVFENPDTGQQINAIDYVMGTGSGTWRGERYESEAVRTAVNEVERLFQRLQDTEFFDLKDRAWATFREIYGLSDPIYDDYWEYRDQEELRLANYYVQSGIEPVPSQARRKAEQEVGRYETVTEFNKFYRERYRHNWVVELPSLAVEAIAAGLLNPDVQESRFLTEYTGGIPDREPQRSSGIGRLSGLSGLRGLK